MPPMHRSTRSIASYAQSSTAPPGITAAYPQLLVDIEIALDGRDGGLHVGIVFDASLDGL